MKSSILPLASAALLAACAGPVETRISNYGEYGVEAATYAWAPVMSDGSADLKSAKNLVAEELRRRGFSEAGNAMLYVELTLASRSADLALSTGGNTVIAPAKRKRPFQSCADQEYRLGISITRISDGASLYRATASEYHCKQPIASVLPVLVTAAMTDLGKPRGIYTVRR